MLPFFTLHHLSRVKLMITIVIFVTYIHSDQRFCKAYIGRVAGAIPRSGRGGDTTAYRAGPGAPRRAAPGPS